MREGAWVGRAPAGPGNGRHVEVGGCRRFERRGVTLCCAVTVPLPSRRVAASRGQYRWCGGGGSLHRPAAGAAITSMRGGCRRLVWLEAYAAPPKPYCRSSAWRLGRAAVVVADGIWRRRRRLALPSGRNSDPAALAGGGAPTAARPWLRIHLTLSPQRLSVLAVPLRGVFQVLTTQGDRGQKDRLRSCRSAPT